jgi:ribosome-binding factor A
MESTRLLKISRLLQKEIGTLLQRESRTICNGKMVTVTTVRVSPDLSLAKVYISIFPSENSKETLNHIKDQIKLIRHKIGLNVRNQLRILPELEFFIDDSLDYIEKLEKLIKPSKNP